MYYYSFNKNKTKLITYLINSNKKYIYILVGIFTNSWIILWYHKICPNIYDKYNFLDNWTISK